MLPYGPASRFSSDRVLTHDSQTEPLSIIWILYRGGLQCVDPAAALPDGRRSPMHSRVSAVVRDCHIVSTSAVIHTPSAHEFSCSCSFFITDGRFRGLTNLPTRLPLVFLCSLGRCVYLHITVETALTVRYRQRLYRAITMCADLHTILASCIDVRFTGLLATRVWALWNKYAFCSLFHVVADLTRLHSLQFQGTIFTFAIYPHIDGCRC